MYYLQVNYFNIIYVMAWIASLAINDLFIPDACAVMFSN